MEKDLAGKTALVTGGGRGLGKNMARRLAEAGALVAINYAGNQEAAEANVAHIAQAGGEAFALQAKLGDQASAEELAEKLTAELTRRKGSPKLDILVNNIGGGDYADFKNSNQAVFDQQFNNNVRGAFLLTRALDPYLADFGRVINISSAGARLTDPNIMVYTMAKAAVDAFTRVLAVELGPRGITVNGVAPGFTAGETNDYIANDPVAAKAVTDITALRRFGQPEEIADVVYMLCSQNARWVTAQTVEASGGFKL